MLWTEAKDKFALALPNYQARANQDALAEAIQNALTSRSHLLAQAGCGTGKSYAGCVPAINQSKKTKLPTIYATATKALQDQLANKDLPFLASVLGDFSYVVLKGRSNYVCQAKVAELDSSLRTLIEKDTLDEGFSGEYLDLASRSAFDAATVTTTSDECPGAKDCPFAKTCFAEIAKKKAREANVVVVNHAVLAADLMVKSKLRALGIPEDKITSILPQFGGVVIDEAHEMENYVTNALGEEITAGSYRRLATLVTNFLEKKDAKALLDDAANNLFNKVARILANRNDKRSKSVRIEGSTLVELSEPIARLIDALEVLEGRVASENTHGNDKRTQQKVRLVKRLTNTRNKLVALLTAEVGELVRWLALGDGVKGDSINWAPLSVADFLREELWNKAPATLMSATLAEGDDFSFLAARLGIDEFDGFDAGTPFDFKRQARTFIPQIPAPVEATKNQWRSAAHSVSAELVRASNGRALFLYTSKSEMDEAHYALTPLIKRMGHRVLKQGEMPNKELAAIFKDDEHSVLFATKSFFTGIDVQGDSLRLLVIDKLPFPVPTDVIFKARCDMIDRGRNPFDKGGSFHTLTIPTMILDVQQGFGRLIRTIEDAGLVAIMDSRLHGKGSKPYGYRIMKALPEAPIITSVDEATSYLEGLEA